MKLFDLLMKETVVETLAGKTKEDVIKELATIVAANSEGIDGPELARILMERESLGSTGIGEGVAIPHGKYPGIKFLTGALGRSLNGVDFQSMDGKPTHLFFLLVAPENSAGLHLKALARVSRLLKTEKLRKKLLDADSRDEMVGVLREEDERL